jgi:hypothetical protein
VTTKYQGEETRSNIVVNEVADQCMIYIAPDQDHEKSRIIVGADLIVIGGKKHTFHRERTQYHFKEAVEPADLEKGLDRALQLTMEWMLVIHQDHEEK